MVMRGMTTVEEGGELNEGFGVLARKNGDGPPSGRCHELKKSQWTTLH